MLEPLFRCNLACSGRGKIDYPDENAWAFDECMQAADKCGAPIVSIAGGEPLIYDAFSYPLSDHVIFSDYCLILARK
jgi:MoaA/NifB/PqqE/SkfB family radical SAM enzyme